MFDLIELSSAVKATQLEPDPQASDCVFQMMNATGIDLMFCGSGTTLAFAFLMMPLFHVRAVYKSGLLSAGNSSLLRRARSRLLKFSLKGTPNASISSTILLMIDQASHNRSRSLRMRSVNAYPKIAGIEKSDLKFILRVRANRLLTI